MKLSVAKQYAVAYLGFEITGAKKISPMFLKDRFLYTVSL